MVLLLILQSIQILGFSFNNMPKEYNNILPPINNIYKAKINIPFIGCQNIEYERTKQFESQVRLNGLINEIGTIYLNKNNPYDYTFDEVLKNIVKKYKCQLYNPHYDNVNDLIIFKIKIRLLNYGKTITLKNI